MAMLSGLVIVSALAAYLPGVAPTITWSNGGADSGDLATAVLVAGVPHPPGYPTYMLLALAWMRVPLPGDVAHRLAVLSALGAALSAGVLTMTLVRLAPIATTSKWVGAIGAVYGGLTLASSPLLWSQATIAEVYAPGLIWVAMLGFVMLPCGPALTVRRTIVAAAIGGLGFGALPQIVLAGPGALAVLLARFGRSATTIRCLLWCSLAAGAGLLTLAYLPLRAAADPVANWGDPSSFERFVDVVTSAEYRYVVGMIGPIDWLVRAREGIFHLGQNLLVPGIALALFACKSLWSVFRSEILYLVSLILLTLVVRAMYPAEGNLVYLIPAVYAGAMLAGLGLMRTMDLILSRFRPALAWLVAAGAISFAISSAGLTVGRVDASGDWTALLVAERLLDEAPSRALLVSRSDETTFALWYAQAMGHRPDIVVVDQRLLIRAWYREQLGRRHPELILNAARLQVAALDRPSLAVDGPSRAAYLRRID
jgi:hypothetical protein